jgi:hypothetical protein
VALTDDYNADEWLLLRDALALVASYCKSEIAAERLLLEFAREGRFPRYRFHRSDARNSPSDTGNEAARGIAPRLWGYSSDVVRIGVDWAKSSVRYLRVEPDPKNVSHHEHVKEVLQHLREHLPREPVVQIHLVRLHRDDVLAMLRSTGLLPPAAAEVEAAPAPPRLSRGQTERWVYA